MSGNTEAEKAETKHLVKLLMGPSARDDEALNVRLLASVWDEDEEEPSFVPRVVLTL